MVGARGQRRGSGTRKGASARALAADDASAASEARANARGERADAGDARLVAINTLVPLRDRRMLQFLSRATRVPQSEYLREAVRDLLRKYRDSFDGSPFEDEEPL